MVFAHYSKENNIRQSLPAQRKALPFGTPQYFSRVFKRATGVSFTEYLNGVRIKEAQRLLIKTDKTIYDIAEAVGYKSASHFGRSFTAITGISPSEYRRKRGARGSPARQCILNYE